MRRICVVLTARASYSRFRAAMQAIDAHPDLQLQIVTLGSANLPRYGDAAAVIEADGFRIEDRLLTHLEGESPLSMAQSTGVAISQLAPALDRLAPDIVVTVADRYETLAISIAATYQGLFLCHVQGGEVSGNIDDRVRNANSKLADLHLVATRRAAERVEALGEAADRVICTGCPSLDLADGIRPGPLGWDPFSLYGGVGASFDLTAPYLLVMQHPVTDEYADAETQVHETLGAVAESGLPAIWFWPNPDAGSAGTAKGIRKFRERHACAGMHFFINVEPCHFLELLANAACLVGNSSVGIREASFLGVPVVNIGSRQRGRERGPNVRDVVPRCAHIAKAIAAQVAHGRYRCCEVYGDGKAGERVAEVLATAALTRKIG